MSDRMPIPEIDDAELREHILRLRGLVAEGDRRERRGRNAPVERFNASIKTLKMVRRPA